MLPSQQLSDCPTSLQSSWPGFSTLFAIIALTWNAIFHFFHEWSGLFSVYSCMKSGKAFTTFLTAAERTMHIKQPQSYNTVQGENLSKMGKPEFWSFKLEYLKLVKHFLTKAKLHQLSSGLLKFRLFYYCRPQTKKNSIWLRKKGGRVLLLIWSNKQM